MTDRRGHTTDEGMNLNWWEMVNSTDCPYCGVRIYGTERDIDSGLRKHLDYCEEKPDDVAFVVAATTDEGMNLSA